MRMNIFRNIDRSRMQHCSSNFDDYFGIIHIFTEIVSAKPYYRKVIIYIYIYEQKMGGYSFSKHSCLLGLLDNP